MPKKSKRHNFLTHSINNSGQRLFQVWKWNLSFKSVPKFRIPHNVDDAYEIELAHHTTNNPSNSKMLWAQGDSRWYIHNTRLNMSLVFDCTNWSMWGGEKKGKEKRCGVRDEKTRGSKNKCMGATRHSRI